MGDPRTVELKPGAATIESFAPYGVLPPDEGDGNPTADLEFLLHDGWVNYIGHSLDEIEVRAGMLRCEHGILRFTACDSCRYEGDRVACPSVP